MSFPPEDVIQAFMDWTALAVPRNEAIRRLKAHNNDVEQACNEYWNEIDNGGAVKSTWDESQFNSDRDGVGNSHGTSFNIQGPDDPGFGPYLRFDSAAPSRPPSRTSNNKSPLSKIIDLTAEHAAADPRTSLTAHERSDRELEEALAASRAEAGLPPQETGITSINEPHFGPATREQYEEGQWGMVLRPTPSQERAMEPEPAFRKRDLGSPAFLKSSSSNYRLAALLTIYHEIPIARSIFVNPPDVLPTYPYDDTWWTGKTIPNLDVEDEAQDLAVDRELQRLMAFLDNTERSYGSVDQLAFLPDVKKERRMYFKLEIAVLWAWSNLMEGPNPGMVKQLFSKGVGSEAEEAEGTPFAILELTLPRKDSCQETLYDVADEVLWPTLGALEIERSPYLSHIGEVIAFKIEGKDNEHKSIDVPAIWYPDRYLKPARQAALEMRLEKSAVHQELERLAMIEERLTITKLSSGKIVKVQDLFKACLKHDEAEVKEDKDPDVDMLADTQPSQAATKLSAELRKIMASIDKKLISLNAEKERAMEELRKLSKLYTEPSANPADPKLTPYTLRGVSTTKNTMYICRRAEPDLIEVAGDDDFDGPATSRDQWWKIHYTPMASKPVLVEKTTEAKVLAAAKNENKNTLLVYASEKAMDHINVVLPKPLESFVHKDNFLFRKELSSSDSHMTNGDAQMSKEPGTPPLSSPGKRKFEEIMEDKDATQIQVTERGSRSGSEDNEWNPTRQAAHAMDNGVNGNEQHEVIVGVDPSSFYQNGAQPEMKEIDGLLPILSGRPKSTAISTIDSMDLDQVVEDENLAKESSAVKRVGFK